MRQWRERLGLSQSKAAAAIGATGFMAISRWERGVVKPRRSTALRIEELSKGHVPIASWDIDAD